ARDPALRRPTAPSDLRGHQTLAVATPSPSPSPSPRPRLAVAVGDPRGIGPEVVRKALRQPIDAAVRIVGGWEDGAPSDVEAGRVAAQSIEAAARLALSGEVDAIVTGPVNKSAL